MLVCLLLCPQELSLAGNCLTELPPSIGFLTQLKKLGLAGNRLTSLPEEIGNLTKLEVSNTEVLRTCAKHNAGAGFQPSRFGRAHVTKDHVPKPARIQLP
jgi:hypothetical protein